MPERDPQRTRGRLLRMAEKEFADHGYEGARVDRICRKARVNMRMLYHYFGSKRGLYRAVFKELTDWLVTCITENLASSGSEGPVDFFATVVATEMKLMTERPAYTRIVLHDALDGFSLDDEINREGDPGAPIRAAFQALVEQGARNGVVAEPDAALDALGVAVIFLLVYPVFKSRLTPFLNQRGVAERDHNRYVAQRVTQLLVPHLKARPREHNKDSVRRRGARS